MTRRKAPSADSRSAVACGGRRFGFSDVPPPRRIPHRTGQPRRPLQGHRRRPGQARLLFQATPGASAAVAAISPNPSRMPRLPDPLTIIAPAPRNDTRSPGVRRWIEQEVERGDHAPIDCRRQQAGPVLRAHRGREARFWTWAQGERRPARPGNRRSRPRIRTTHSPHRQGSRLRPGRMNDDLGLPGRRDGAQDSMPGLATPEEGHAMASVSQRPAQRALALRDRRAGDWIEA